MFVVLIVGLRVPRHRAMANPSAHAAHAHPARGKSARPATATVFFIRQRRRYSVTTKDCGGFSLRHRPSSPVDRSSSAFPTTIASGSMPDFNECY
jgi:hypothetical protein